MQSYRRTAMRRRPASAIATVAPGAQALEATRPVEEIIVEKVFREGLTGTLGISEASAAIGEILPRLIFGSSEEARSVQRDIFIEVLERMAMDPFDGQIGAAAKQLLDLLASKQPPEER
ncbi:hypothetical protein [Streptomyces sp. NPDC056061]|uniref:hypothetical protein n=1 Tax=Streptomyces sp. NPDC056061 TaxID=3345700 RepID=UPI0035DB3075